MRCAQRMQIVITYHFWTNILKVFVYQIREMFKSTANTNLEDFYCTRSTLQTDPSAQKKTIFIQKINIH